MALRSLVLSAAAAVQVALATVSVRSAVFSAGCQAALSNVSAGAPPAGCSNFSALLSAPGLAVCVGDVGALGSCAITFAPITSGVVNVSTPPPACPLCSADQAGCNDALSAVIGALKTSPALAPCNNDPDSVALALLRDQGRVRCNNALPTTYGDLDMNTLPQCSTCGVLPCLAGTYCPGNAPPEICSAGWYCPTSTQRIKCPSGYYCPERSSAPTACRAIASCPEGSSREVVWVPLFISLLLLVALAAALRARAWALSGRARREDASLSHKALLPSALASPQPPPATPAPSSSSEGAAPPAALAEMPRITVRFSDVRLVTGGVTRLNGVSGSIAAGRLTAIMGGSGAGKTTLASALLGKEDITGGSIELDVAVPPQGSAGAGGGGAAAAEASLVAPGRCLRPLLGFVPQLDIMSRDATVRQIVEHSAFTRLPAAWGAQRKREHVEHVLSTMHLTHVADTVVGDETAADNAGVSSGERKRVNIAMELAANPSVLFLDEPTTGIDSTSALRLLELLRGVVRGGLTVAAVIHQPRQEIVDLVDDLVLLGKGGRPVFIGPMALALPYFEAVLGYRCPGDTSPMDFIMDTVDGKHGFPGAAAPGGEPAPANALAERLSEEWMRSGFAWVASHAPAGSPAASPAPAPATREQLRDGAAALARLTPSRPGLLAQVLQFALLGWAEAAQSPAVLYEALAVFLGGCVLGIVSAGEDLFVLPVSPFYYQSCPQGAELFCKTPLHYHIFPATFYISIGIGVIAIPAGVRSLGAGREVFWREAGVGVNRLAYYLGRIIADAPKLVLLAFFFTAPLFAIAPWRAPVQMFYAAVLTNMAFIFALGYALSAAIPSLDAANLTAVVLAVIMNLFSGFVGLLGNNGGWAYTHWVQRSYITIELMEGLGLDADSYNFVVYNSEFQNPNWPKDLGILIAFIVATHALAFCILVFRHREKQR